MDADAAEVDDADAFNADYAGHLVIMMLAQVHAVPEEDFVALWMWMLMSIVMMLMFLMLTTSIIMPAQVHAVPEEDYVALPYNSMERPVINGEDSVPLKFTIS